MIQNEFTIVLPSNSSEKYFPNNTTTNYSTRLPREVELSGKWMVGVSEIHVPCTTLHLRKEDTCIAKSSIDNNLTQDYYFKHGTYETIQSIVDSINEGLYLFYKKKCLKLFYDKKGGFVSLGKFKDVSVMRECNLTALSETVKRILGFEHGIELVPEEPVIDSHVVTFIGKQPASLARAIPDQLFVYSNICEPTIVGDTHAPLLRIVNIDAQKYRFGCTIVKRYAPVNYIPLLTNRFQIIDIDIRDQFGKPIPFEFGTLTVTLHFKREY